jgi:hypothetical protein
MSDLFSIIAMIGFFFGYFLPTDYGLRNFHLTREPHRVKTGHNHTKLFQNAKK